MTGNLDEVALEKIEKQSKLFQEISARKESMIKALMEQNLLTEELRIRLTNCFDKTELEDLYLPFKKKRKTRAEAARQKGLEPLAKMIMAQNHPVTEATLNKFITHEVSDTKEALNGALDIIAEWISENLRIRSKIRHLFQKTATIGATVIKGKENEEAAQKYRQYFDREESLSRIPSHRFLALLRANTEGFLRLKVSVDPEEALHIIVQNTLKSGGANHGEIHQAAEESWKRLLEPSLVNEALAQAKERADEKAIAIFADNLRQLLLAPPLGEKRILAIDPGFRTGCKVVCLDEKGDLLHNETIYPHPPQKESGAAMKKIRSLVNAYQIEAISIGDGTASRETELFIQKIAFDKPVKVFVVSEAGASVYSASKLAREEFPQYDITVRGAVSIGRRLADPLAELVKIDPKSIGVGQYQHDVNPVALKEALDQTTISCVNRVGINLNTASKELLSYVSGIGPKLAENIVNYRSEKGEFTCREELLQVPRLGAKAYEQAAGFLRVRHSKNPLDNSAVHPEAYPLVRKMAQSLQLPECELIGNKEAMAKIRPEDFQTPEIGVLTIQDILKELLKPGLDPRKAARIFEFDKNIHRFEDLREGMILPGVVNNITAFGCFVNLGIKESGLVHISQLKNGFVSDVSEVVKLHQQVEVKVVSLDPERRRIGLSMILE